MSWQDDDLLWERLDDMIMNSYGDVKAFLDNLAEYKTDLGMINSTILFGGFGCYGISNEKSTCYKIDDESNRWISR